MSESLEEVVARLEALAETEGEHTGELLPFLAHPAPEIREAAVWALWNGNLLTMANPLLERLATDEDALVQSAVVTTLGRYVYEGAMMSPNERSTPLGKKVLEVTRLLRELFITPETPPLIRRRALEALSFDADETIEESILAWAEDPDPMLRKSAAFAMGRVSGERFYLALLRLLNDEDSRVVVEAIRSSGEHGLKKAVPALVALTQGSDDELAREAVTALGLVGGTKAVSALRALTQDSRSWMAAAALVALEEAGTGPS